MIIFGTRGVTYNAATSEFYCPNCATQSPYKHKRVRRFFTLYFIPVIPLDLHGEYVECQRCNGTYQMNVLELDPEAAMVKFEAAFQLAMKRVMVLMMLADGVVEDEEIEVIRAIYSKLASAPISDEEIQEEIARAREDGLGIADFLGGLAGNLNDQGKEAVLRAALMVAAADGEFQDEEKELISAIGRSLAMTAAHVNGVFQSMVAGDSG